MPNMKQLEGPLATDRRLRHVIRVHMWLGWADWPSCGNAGRRLVVVA
jgi:hypothetical protein